MPGGVRNKTMLYYVQRSKGNRMETMLSINLIASNPNVRSGRPVIAGTGIEVSAIAIMNTIHGQTPDQIAADYRLTLAQVHAALAYYYDHKAEIDDRLAADRAFVEAFRAKQAQGGD
jgi:uncharacterized protein (DUF433 family)